MSRTLGNTPSVVLTKDRNPSATIRMTVDTEKVTVGGIVEDMRGAGLAEVLVSIVGHGDDAVRTKEGGNFSLPAHAAIGDQVLLHAERKGFRPKDQYHKAGDQSAVIRLTR